MNELQIFSNNDFGEIRIINIDGKPCAIANEIAKILGYSNPSKATTDHCKNAFMVWGNDSLGRKQEYKVIPESDIFRLIIKSQLPTAEKFERWIFEEVIPTIRQTGGYSMNPPDMELLVRDTIEKSVGIVIKQLLPLVHSIIETSAESAVQHIALKNSNALCNARSNQKVVTAIDKLDVEKIVMIETMLCCGELTFSDIVEVLEGNNIFVNITDIYEYAKTIKVI